MPFRTTRKHLAPRWLTEDEGEAVGYTLDIIKDAFARRIELGLLARFPEQDADGTAAPADALAAMGRDRRVIRGRNEATAGFVRRLKSWLDDRKTAGNPHTLMQRLAEYTGEGPSFRTYDNAGNSYHRAADGSRSLTLGTSWDWDGDAAQWARFWVIIYPDGLWTAEGSWGSGTWGDGDLWGATITADDVATLRALVADWKPAGTTCVYIILALDAASFDPTAPEPDGTWSDWSAAASPRAPSRLSTARFINGA
jgi:hypothetical protein